MTDEWLVETHRGSAAELHGAPLPDDERPRLWILEPTGPAVVLGSTQPVELVDPARAAANGVEIARRRSGGGAVWVAPGDPVWVDVLIPRGHRLWRDDIGASFEPIGDAWHRALVATGAADADALTVHRGRFVAHPWSGVVCFAGLGPGEVRVGGAKVVGISQRRTRLWARFQCAALRTWDPAPLLAVLDPDRLPAEPPSASLAAVGIGISLPEVSDLVAALTAALDRLGR